MKVEWKGQFVMGMTEVQRLETAMEFLGNVLDMRGHRTWRQSYGS